MMNVSDITFLIKDAITSKNELFIKIKAASSSAFREIRFCPYIYGIDPLKFQFVWGFMPQYQTFYKIHLQQIEEAEIIRIMYTPFPNAKYLKPDGEEHLCVLDGGWKYRP